MTPSENAVATASVRERAPSFPRIAESGTTVRTRGVQRELVHRRKRTGRRQPVARAPKDAHVASVVRAKSLDQRAFAETRLARHEYELAGTHARIFKAPEKHVELLLALKKWVHSLELSVKSQGRSQSARGDPKHNPLSLNEPGQI
jgi:hypothetical protein